ncbi:PD-(D/E)XK nuclease family protein [Nitrosomonas oligotropha]|uniref:PD-(D/E)XK nuclease superfamily protein n=1 Tax=Nitrosomonas oligotropha TaxID=42354 RepID=A0A1H8QLE4_9PROT|nr:PD-(D/E)XK nuclease family protein [Nitrosomonas oligotropha]SDW86566.1 PD-(D/E)XK nuclease superfamily protein [Nitrosomonas oligotropha]SEO55050.1 PD-(D/E)XK nuclease superfamily protein [Nitrosomonas oligotropha]
MNEPSITIRASSWAGLFDCAYRWEGIHLLKMKNTVGLRAALGTAIHAGSAVFDQARISGDTVTVNDAAGVLVDKLRDPENEYDPNKDDLTKPEAESIGITLLSKYCLEVSPNYNFVAVEMETKPMDIDCGGGIIVQLTGTMDRARIKKSTNGIGIADLKSGSSAVQKGAAVTKGHAAQVGTYELLFEHTTGEPITSEAEIIGLNTKGKAVIATGFISNAKKVMTGDQDNPGLIEFAADMFRSGRFYPNPKSLLCSEKYCPRWKTCHFKGD